MGSRQRSFMNPAIDLSTNKAKTERLGVGGMRAYPIPASAVASTQRYYWYFSTYGGQDHSSTSFIYVSKGRVVMRGIY